MLTPLLMTRVVKLLVPLFVDKAPWKVCACYRAGFDAAATAGFVGGDDGDEGVGLRRVQGCCWGHVWGRGCFGIEY